MGEHLLEKRYTLHLGLNPRASDLTRPMEYASGMRNAQYTTSGSPEKRKGFQAHAVNVGGYGTFHYNRVDPTTEVETPEVLTVDSNLYKRNAATMTVAYIGASPTCQLSFFYDTATSVYRLQIIEGNSTVLDKNCGLGFDELSTVTLANLKTLIDAITGFSATIVGATTTPAAFLKIVRAHDLSATGSSWEGMAISWSQVNSTVTDPFSTYYARRNDDDFENVSGVVINNVLYLANGYNEIHKYDGQTFYRAGLPQPASITSALGAAGSITGNNYFHQMQYVQYDAAGQIFEGNVKRTSAGVNATSDKIDLVLANIQAGTGFNTNCAIAAGAQSTVNTLTVDDGSGGTHTMKAGDTAYFYDGVAMAYVTRAVTAVTSTTITVAGAPVTVADNAVISNNLRITVWRNKTSSITPSIFYLVAELPNNSFAATQAYVDDLADTSLGDLFLPPVTDRSPPPKAKYISSFQSHMVLAGNLSFQRRLFWSDLDGCEYFPSDTNQNDMETTAGDVIKGIGPGGAVFGIFSRKGTFVLSGTLGDNNIRIEQKAADIGCEAHASIIELKGVLCWWSSRGPYAMANGQIPQPLGTVQDAKGNLVGRIEPVMIQDGLLPDHKWRTQRITAINWIANKKALWFLPAESTSVDGDNYSNSNSRIYAYDYDQDAWLEWSNIDMTGGAVIYQDEFYFKERRYSDFEEEVVSLLYRMHNLNDAWDYEDNNEPIDWQYDMGWEALGEPSVLKRYIEMKAFALEELPNNEFELTVTQELNYQKDAGVAVFDLSFSGIGYGISEYGIAKYGDIAEASVRHDLKRERCRSMRLRLSNEVDHQNCIVSGIELLIAAPYRKEFKG